MGTNSGGDALENMLQQFEPISRKVASLFGLDATEFVFQLNAVIGRDPHRVLDAAIPLASYSSIANDLAFERALLPCEAAGRFSLRGISASDADDIISEAKLRMRRRRDFFLTLRSREAYFIVIVKRIAIDMKRRDVRNKECKLDVSHPDSRSQTPDVIVEHREENQKLHECIGRLKMDQQFVVFLRIFEELTRKEVAVSLEMSAATVERREKQAFESLRVCLGFAWRRRS